MQDPVRLPPEQEKTLKAAIRIEWATIAFLAVAIPVVGAVVGSSQAMKAAWIEDLLSLAPPIAFLVAVRILRKPATAKYPYGFFRSVGVAHLVSGVALVTMGVFLIVDSATGLIAAEHPPIGSVEVFGQTVWAGWLMMIAMALTIPLPIYFGHVKMKLARDLHNKVLYADADMNEADWMTAVGSIIGVAGIGIGLWWADAVAALFIASSILWDGIRNTRGAITDLVDTRAMTFDDHRPHPVRKRIDDYLRSLSWVDDACSRVRDQGQFFHVEAFVIPHGRRPPSTAKLEEAREVCRRIDWKAHDVVIIPVSEFPRQLSEGSKTSQADRVE